MFSRWKIELFYDCLESAGAGAVAVVGEQSSKTFSVEYSMASSIDAAAISDV
jgi:hypothetical protein